MKGFRIRLKIMGSGSPLRKKRRGCLDMPENQLSFVRQARQSSFAVKFDRCDLLAGSSGPHSPV